ncbi:MAG: hypothetical protein GY774_31475 [Planctomycetes bacterium]|nr:hypothetical protein [Planctomycetota bacterium]
MSKGPVRFTSQWILVGVIMFYTIGTAMIARHTKRIFKPASAGGSEHSAYSNSIVSSERPVQPRPVVGEYWQNNNNTSLNNWGPNGSNLMLDIAFGTEQFYDGNNTPEPSDEQIAVEDCKAEKTEVQQELTKIRTKRKCVERILKKAVIKPYSLNGQTKGLQMTGLDVKTEADAIFLKNGDIILAVNGQILKSKKQAYDIFKKARKEPIMIIDILQKGKAKKYLLDFQ